ncbi:uncharacterized protein LOC119615056 [Lucilia sericata]|nr:uncharacterized protein LOC119603444 [Lucilia sericata]XP_037827066.1 uncharacterized protein LOC119615056 [Lucilia sericata]
MTSCTDSSNFVPSDYPLVQMEDINLNLSDFEDFLSSRKPDSAGGADGITYRMLLNLSDSGRKKLFAVLNRIWISGNIPDIWRHIKVHPIPKREDSVDITDYRPICLLPVLLKCIEGMLKPHMEQFANSRKIIPERSFAFRKNMSTTQCINDLINTVQYLRTEKRKVVAICIDIEKAYDHVNVNTLGAKLMEMGFNRKLVLWLTSYLQDRTLHLHDAKTKTNRGLAQGSGLSPILFNLYTASLHNIEDENTYIFQFADDFFILAFDETWDEALDILERKFGEFIYDCEQLDLNINYDKTTVTSFGRRSSQINLNFNGRMLTEVKEIKYLGRIVSANNSSLSHVTQAISKINRTCRFLNTTSGCLYGIHPARAIQFYRVYARSQLEYAASSFANLSGRALAKFQTQSNFHVRRALGLMKSTPVHVLYHLAAELPPKYRIQLAAGKDLVKLFHLEMPLAKLLPTLEKPLDTSYYKMFDKFKNVLLDVEQIRTSTVESRKVRTYENFYHSNKANLNPQEVNQIFLSKKNDIMSRNLELVYTDGSIMENQAGGAFFHPRSNTVRRFKLSKTVSSMSVELHIMEKAVEFAKEMNFLKLAILTDSKSGVLALKNGVSNAACSRIHDLIDSSPTLSTVEFHYIPSHRGIFENERVDEEAKKATQDGLTLQIKWSKDEAIREIERRLHDEWEREYVDLSRTKGREFGKIFPSLLRKPWFNHNSLGMNAIQIRQLNRILSGHSFSPHTLARLHVLDDDTCLLCNEVDDDSHIIFECTKYNHIRLRYPVLEQYDNTTSFFRKEPIENYHFITDFIKEANIKL